MAAAVGVEYAAVYFKGADVAAPGANAGPIAGGVGIQCAFDDQVAVVAAVAAFTEFKLVDLVIAFQ